MVPTHALAMASISPVVWITVIVILIIVFGAAKLPDIAKNLGKSAKVLKAELQDPRQPLPPSHKIPRRRVGPSPVIKADSSCRPRITSSLLHTRTLGE